jgi:hypothetical protein
LGNKEDNKVISASVYLMPDFLNRGKVLFSFRGGFLEPLVKGEPLAKLRFLFERVLIQSLATLKLLAGEEMELPLLRLGFLPGQ